MRVNHVFKPFDNFQIECGAQVLQVFESWAHHLSEDQFLTFAKVKSFCSVHKPHLEQNVHIHPKYSLQPHATRLSRYLKAKHPDVPVVYFANGGSGFLDQQLDMGVDGLSVDWRISMARARALAGPDTVLAGNVDPMVLYGGEAGIRAAVETCILQAGRGAKHVLNLGHGIEKDTPEDAVHTFVEAARHFSQHYK